MTLDDLERQKRDFFMDFSGDFELRHKIIHKAAPRYWRWWRGVVGNSFRLKRSYSTPGPVTIMSQMGLGQTDGRAVRPEGIGGSRS